MDGRAGGWMDGWTDGRAEFPRPRERDRERESGSSSLLAVTRMERRDRAGRTAEAGQAKIGDHEQGEERRGEEERGRKSPREYRYLLGGPPGPDV